MKKHSLWIKSPFLRISFWGMITLLLAAAACTPVPPASGLEGFPTQTQASRQVTATLVLQHGVSPNAAYAGTSDVVITNLWEGNTQLGGWEGLDTYRDDQERHRILIRFDLSPLPPGVQIQSATLSLSHFDSEFDDAPQTVSAYRLTAPWTEGSGTETNPDPGYIPDGATYTLAAPGTLWANPGGDFDPTAITAAVIPAFASPGWVDWDLTGLVSQWASGALPNNGLILRTSDGDYTGHRFYSRNYGDDPTLRPRLTIVYGGDAGELVYLPTILKENGSATATPTPTSTATPTPDGPTTTPTQTPTASATSSATLTPGLSASPTLTPTPGETLPPITELRFVTILPVGSDPQAIVATAGRVFVSDHNDVNRELYAYNVSDWTLAGNWAQMAGNEGGAVFGNTVYFPDTFDDGVAQITRLIRIDASTLNITPIPLDFSAITYSVCSGDLSTNNDMTLDANGSTAYVLWNRGIAVVDLTTNAQTSFFTLPEGMVCTDEIQSANGNLYISAFEAGGRLMVLDATTGAYLGDVFPAGSLQPAGFDRSPDGSTVYFNDFYGPRVGRVNVATGALGAFVDLPAGGNSFDLAADPTAGSPYVYVVREDGMRLEALNMVANTVESSADTPWFIPRAVETSPDGRYVYIAGQNWDWPPLGFLVVFEIVR